MPFSSHATGRVRERGRARSLLAWQILALLVVVATVVVALVGTPDATAVQNSEEAAAGGGREVLSTRTLPPSEGAPLGWEQVLAEGFDVDVPEGSFLDVYGHAARPDGGWWAYGYDWESTAGTSRYGGGEYVSVRDGILRIRLHTDEHGVHRSEALMPPVDEQTYGRYIVRFRVPESVEGYKLVFLLWPASDNWDEGEIDFPETDLGRHDTMMGFSHRANVGAPHENALVVDTGTNVVGDWHTTELVWADDHVAFYLDGVLHGTVSTETPHTPMNWVLQTEGHLGGDRWWTGIDPAVSGYVEIDWVAAYAPASQLVTFDRDEPSPEVEEVPERSERRRGDPGRYERWRMLELAT